MKNSQLASNGMNILFIENQTEEICVQAVKQNGLALPFVLIQTPTIVYEAVKQNGLALRYVEQQTLEIIATALLQNKLAYKYINYYLTDLIESLLSHPIIKAIPEMINQIFTNWRQYVDNIRNTLALPGRSCT